MLANGDLDASAASSRRRRQPPKGQSSTVRHSDLADKRGFVPLITQEDLDNTTLDDVEVNFVSPNISGINSNVSGASPPRRVNRSRKHNLSEDMNDLSAIQKANNGDSLNQTNLELIRKLQSRSNVQSELSESDTSIAKVGPGEESTQKQTKPATTEEEQSDVHFKLDNFDLQSANSHIFKEEELQQYEDHIQEKINDVWNDI